MTSDMTFKIFFFFFIIYKIDSQPLHTSNNTKKAILNDDERFEEERLRLLDNIKKHEAKVKLFQEKLKEKEINRKFKLIKEGKLRAPGIADDIRDPDYFIKSPELSPDDKEKQKKLDAEVRKAKDEIYHDHVKWPTISAEEGPDGQQVTEHFSGPDESKDLSFTDFYQYKSTIMDPTMDGFVHPFDNPDHPDCQNVDIAYKKYYRYNSEEINYFNNKYNITLSKDMFTPMQPLVTGLNISDWFNHANNSHIAKIYHFNNIKINEGVTAKYIKYVYTPIFKRNTMYENTTTPEGFDSIITDFPDQDPVQERILKNMEIPFYEDHIQNSTWCFICGDTFSHPSDRRPHITAMHNVHGDFGKDRLSDPNWEWKENIQIYRRPRFFPRSYEEYADNYHLTADDSFDHYEYWDLKRKAGEITFPNRPETRNLTKKPIDKNRYNEIRKELQHFIWMPPKDQRYK